MKIPQLLLRQLYTFGSLTNEPGGFRLSLKNRLSDVTLTRIIRVKFDHQEFPLEPPKKDWPPSR